MAAAGRFVQRRPAPLAVAAAAVMLILAIPVLSLRLGSSDAGNDPASKTTHQDYELSPTDSAPASTARCSWSAPPPPPGTRPRSPGWPAP